MNLELNLYSAIEGLVPSSLQPPSIRLLTHDLMRLLQAGNVSLMQYETALNIYKKQVPFTVENNKRWENLMGFIERLCRFDNHDDILRYLSGSQLSPIRINESSRINASMLDQETLHKHENLLSPFRSPSVYAESFENLDKYSERRSIISSHKNYHPNKSLNVVPLESLVKPYYINMVSEEDMLTYISYTLLATTSYMLPMEYGKITIPKNVPNADSGLLHLISEAGLLYQKLNHKIEQYKTVSISPMKKTLVVQIGQCLRNYTGFINMISSQGSSSSMKSLYYNLYDKIIQLRLFYRFMENFDDTDGDMFLAQLNILKSHGDITVKETSEELFNTLMSIYYEYLVSWLILGKLTSTHNEFFIQPTTDDEHLPVLINNAKIPEFLPKHVAKKGFIIGKTYIFIQKFCKELQWANEFSKKYSSKYNDVSVFGISNKLFDIIQEQYDEIVKYANQVLIEKFFYKKVVYIIKDILLMGKCDLIEVLIEKANDVLLSPSASLSSYELTRYLQEAVQKSSLRNWLNKSDHNQVINGLDARVLDLGHGSIGWDVFTLDYIIDAPLSIVLNVNRNGGKKEYLRIFNFLWRFKKNNYFINKESLKANMLIRELKKISRNRPLVRDILSKISKINILKSQIQQFNSKLEEYCFQNIIDKNFKEFEKKLQNTESSSELSSIKTIKLKNGMVMLDGILRPKGAIATNTNNSFVLYNKLPNINELDNLHNEFLSNMLSHKLLASNSANSVGAFSGQPYSTSLILLLNMIFEFTTYFSALNDVSHEVLIQMNLNGQQEMSLLLTRFNTVLNNIVDQYKKFQEQSYLFKKELRADGDDDLTRLSRYLR